MSCEQWTIVKGGRRSRHRAQAYHNGHSDHQLHPASNQRSHSPEEITCRVDKLHGTFSSIKAQVHDSEFFRGFQAMITNLDVSTESEPADMQEAATGRGGILYAWQWHDVIQMVVYGLGSPSDSAVPRYQLAFALLVAELLPGLTSPLEAYDPVFNDIDRAFLHRVGVKVLTEDEQGKRVAHAPTLFYLAHCESVLCNNLLWANAPSLSNVAILGNSLQAYYDHWSVDHASSKRDRRDSLSAILHLVEAEGVIETSVNEMTFPTVSNSRPFNDMSLHLFIKPLPPK